MSKIMELRNKRTTLWEQTKAFLEEHRDENGLVAKEAVEQYDRMAADVRALGAEIERLENQAAFEAELKRPTSKPVVGSPTMDQGKKNPVNPMETDEYRDAFWNMMRGSIAADVRNALSIG